MFAQVEVFPARGSAFNLETSRALRDNSKFAEHESAILIKDLCPGNLIFLRSRVSRPKFSSCLSCAQETSLCPVLPLKSQLPAKKIAISSWLSGWMKSPNCADRIEFIGVTGRRLSTRRCGG